MVRPGNCEKDFDTRCILFLRELLQRRGTNHPGGESNGADDDDVLHVSGGVAQVVTD